MNYKSTLPFLMGILLLSQVSSAQNAYRSKQTGGDHAWTTIANWEYFDGISWLPAATYPVSTDGAITITAGDSITLSTAITIDEVTVDGILAIFSSTQTLANGTGIDMQVNGKLHLGLNGILDGTGSLQINSTGTFSLLLSGARVRTPTVNNGHAVVSNPDATSTYIENSVFTNNGTFTISSGRLTINNGELVNNSSLVILSTSPNSYIQSAGTTPVGLLTNAVGGTISKPNTGDFSIGRFINHGLVKGIGNLLLPTVTGNDGSIEPGNSPGILAVPGNFITGRTPTINLEIVSGSGAGTGHDQLQITGAVAPNLSGTVLNVTSGPGVPLTSYTVLTSTTAFTGAPPTVNVPPGFAYTVNASDIVVTRTSLLPVTWGDFTGFDEVDRVRLAWSTIQEIESSHFEIEHSTDGRSFAVIGTVEAAGASNTEKRYSFIHTGPSLTATNIYRIKQYDINGKFSYSPAIYVKLKNSGRPVITATPNPVRNSLQIFATKPNYKMSLTDLSGRTLKTLQIAQGAQYLDVNDLPTGTYYLLFTDGESTFSQKIVKMR
ncbi:MAG TPA: T9SS type A sorting domain-containing protein [Chitinophagaceae bacterium]|nr:T9SS type A sorting domain-containing protein [Chitinophagaceae bacterium]